MSQGNRLERRTAAAQTRRRQSAHRQFRAFIMACERLAADHSQVARPIRISNREARRRVSKRFEELFL